MGRDGESAPVDVFAAKPGTQKSGTQKPVHAKARARKKKKPATDEVAGFLVFTTSVLVGPVWLEHTTYGLRGQW